MAYTDIDSLVYQIPKGYEVERLPNNASYESNYGKYSATTSLEGNQIIYVRKIEQNSGEFPADEWSDFRKYKMEIVKSDKAIAILKKTVN